MKYKVVISDRAKRHLGKHVDFLKKVSMASAKKTKKTIVDSLRTLSEMPRRNPYVNIDALDRNYYRKMLIDNRYLAIYHITDDVVSVDYIFDCRQDYTWLMQ
ncbi:MAG: type II toxin-antitoxin system RelE/ParE family toxin [Ruminococcaceae bacterium]|nr:type II toxin-antitoxin system RelE/ParE family toxin [Oscillospiraceae bacterium]